MYWQQTGMHFVQWRAFIHLPHVLLLTLSLCCTMPAAARYNQHTKHCPHCRVALRNTEIAIGVLAVVAALAAGSFTVAAFNAATAMAAGAAAAAGNGVGTAVAAKLAAGAAAVAGVAAALIVGLLKFRQLFIFIDYVHADH